MEISGTSSSAAQQAAINKGSAGFDVLTKSLQKTQQNEVNASERMEVAEQTGKGINIDIYA